MAQGDPQGWESAGANAPLLYNATINGYKVGASGATGRSLLVTTNKSTGNYDVYEKTLFGNKLLYQYNASTDKVVPNENNLTNYKQYFTGPQVTQLQNLNKAVKSATYRLAENNVTGGQNSISAREFQELQTKSGYQTYGNTEKVEPAADPPGGNVKPPVQKPLGFEEGLELGATLKELDDSEATGQNTNSPAAPAAAPETPEVLRYPLANLDAVQQEFGIGYDYIKIKVVDYVPSLASGNTGIRENLGTDNRSTNRYGQNSKALSYIILPMQPGINEANSVSWGEDSMNILQLLGSSFLNNYFSGISDKGFIESAKKEFIDLYRSFNTLKDGAVASNSEIAALLAGFVTNTNVIQRTTGSVINPNLELLFSGPKMRVFNFNFEMTPRFEAEAEQIRKIIKTFKKYMAPEVTKGNAFLKSPKIFQLEYIYNGDGDPERQGTQHPYLNKIKPCALLDFQVNYTPDGTYMTYRSGGSMTRYTLQMTFAETEPIYQDDQNLSSNDMGY
jgi:hypothetical protein